jgi:branched-chain amino acid transport system ATP-binding protein
VNVLEARALTAGYGAAEILFGVDLEIAAGECVSLIGRNGMGKTTTVKSMVGILTPTSGSVCIGGVETTGRPPYRAAQAGLGLVPEGRQIFANLSVRQNLVATAARHGGQGEPWTLERVYGVFPRLAERAHHAAANLSGGEQQMLAIGRALMTNPKLLVLDEATEGLAPLVRMEIWRCLQGLKRAGLALLVIDKNVGPLLKLADRHYILAKGRVVWTGASAALQADPQLMRDHLGV